MASLTLILVDQITPGRNPQVMNPSSSPTQTDLQVTAPPGRGREPLTCGVPWPRDMIPAGHHIELSDDRGQPVPLQTRVLDRWPDGSVRWALLDWQADVSNSAT